MVSLLLVAGALAVIAGALARAAYRHSHKMLSLGVNWNEYRRTGLLWRSYGCSCATWEVEVQAGETAAPYPTAAARKAHHLHVTQMGAWAE